MALVFLDIDGTLMPFGADDIPTYGRDPLFERLNPAHGPRLTALPAELVWATAWTTDANEYISPLLGLPELPVVSWPDDDEVPGVHWKTRAIVAWAAGRPFVWVDDEIGDGDLEWVAACHGGPALLHRVNPTRGITDDDYTTIHDWLIRQ